MVMCECIHESQLGRSVNMEQKTNTCSVVRDKTDDR